MPRGRGPGKGMGKRPMQFTRKAKGGVLTPMQKRFVEEYIIDLDKKKAAERAGIPAKSAAAVGCRWTNAKAYPAVALAIKRALDQKSLLAQYKADDVLRYLQTGAFLDPRPWFKPGSVQEETWKIKEEDYEKLPVEIVRLIKHAEQEMVYKIPDDIDPNKEDLTDDEISRISNPEPVPTGWLLVQLVNKEQLLALVAKHMLSDSINTNGMQIQINWNDMRKPTTVSITNTAKEEDPIEAEILAVNGKKMLPDAQPNAEDQSKPPQSGKG